MNPHLKKDYEAALKEEPLYLKNDREYYLECMVTPLCERDVQNEREIRDGLIIFHHVYKFCRGLKDVEDV